MPRMYRNGDRVIEHIRRRQTFTIGNVSGEWFSSDNPPRWGRLADADANPDFKRHMTELLKTTDLYVIHSYLTPIAYAWDKTILIPEVRYSTSTTGHQNLARMADRFGPVSTAPYPS